MTKRKSYHSNMSQDSWYSDRLRVGRQGFEFQQGQEIVLYSSASKAHLGPTEPPIQWVPGVGGFFPGETGP
jgi:hypothetical protein